MSNEILETSGGEPELDEEAVELTAEDVPEVEVRTEGEQVQVPAVQILVQRDSDGNIDCDVVATGDVRATEVETVIKMGLNKWRGKIGLPG